MIVKSAEKNVENMFIARLDILGLDSNENHASSPAFSTTGLVNHDQRTAASLDNLSRNYFSMLNLTSAPQRYIQGHLNGHSSPTLSPVDPSVSSPNPWLTSAVSPTSPTISNMITAHPLINCVTSYPTSPPPPPGLGPPVTLTSMANNLPSGYLLNYTGSTPNSDGYINSLSTGN